MRTLFGLVLFLWLSKLFGAELARIGEVFLRILNQPFFTTGQTKINLITLILVFPVFYLANWLAKVIRNFFVNEVFPTLNLEEERISVLSLFIRYFVVGTVSLLGLSLIGLDLSSLTVIFGVLGIGVGFGLQATVSNLFAGLSLIFTRPVREGDSILVGENEGQVAHIKLFYTTVTTFTNESIIIPNSHIINDVVHNYSYNDKTVILKLPFQVAYGSDLEVSRRVVEEAMASCPYKVNSYVSLVHIKGLGNSGVDMEVWLKISNIRNKVQARTWTFQTIYKTLRENGITIPFPQVEVSLNKDLSKD